MFPVEKLEVLAATGTPWETIRKCIKLGSAISVHEAWCEDPMLLFIWPDLASVATSAQGKGKFFAMCFGIYIFGHDIGTLMKLYSIMNQKRHLLYLTMVGYYYGAFDGQKESGEVQKRDSHRRY
ncbi:hypothetical protein MKW98_005531 [Papaver atlanticum]|uniref:Uncharacterized protein n=1 Tax=Papaver atlanticum TaxID=357466 RepID=A0AAD4XTA2_9MAGN|nr:hypothetical protein MKW98_005531 [Papaver atlanticum]